MCCLRCGDAVLRVVLLIWFANCCALWFWCLCFVCDLLFGFDFVVTWLLACLVYIRSCCFALCFIVLIMSCFVLDDDLSFAFAFYCS